MFWGEKLREEIKRRFRDEIGSGTKLVIRDEKTMSGRVHVGSLRGVVIHGVVSELLTDAGIANDYLFEINDFDPMDGLPTYLDEATFRPFMGRPLCDIPSPDTAAKNYAEYFAQEFIEVVQKTGFFPSYYRSSDYYRAGRYNGVIREALDHADVIRTIYREVSGSVKPHDWFPLQVVCENCGKIGTTKVTAWDGTSVTYECLPDLVRWASGCSHRGVISPFDGKAKLPWKVEWPAKFKVVGVHVEGGGKDHYTKGGPRDIARRIVKEVFRVPEPVDIPYNFFVTKGKKMSSSKGVGSTSREIADLLPMPLLRFLLMKEPKREIDFEPYGDSIPVLYDRYDEIAGEHFSGAQSEWSSVYPYFFQPSERGRLTNVYRPRFSQIAYLTQMPHVNLSERVAEMKSGSLTADDEAELSTRVEYAKRWLALYSPEKYKFELQENLPASAGDFSEAQRSALDEIRAYIVQHERLDGHDLHTFIHSVKDKFKLPPAALFSAVYLSFLGKESGPQAGWFLTALNREFVIRRLGEASKGGA